jgi:hypothetical protein
MINKTTALPTQEYLRELFDYDPNTGVLTYKQRPLSHFKTKAACSRFNSQFAGKSAGSKHPTGYIQLSITLKYKRKYWAHRVIHMWMTGEDPGTAQVDHVNQLRDDNRWENLRLVDGSAENRLNQSMRSDNTSGATGVSWCSHNSKWQATIRVRGEHKHLVATECFDTAVAVRRAAEIEHGFHPNHGLTRPGLAAT